MTYGVNNKKVYLIKKHQIHLFLFGCTLNRVDRLNSINAIFLFGYRKRGILIGKIKSTKTKITRRMPLWIIILENYLI